MSKKPTIRFAFTIRDGVNAGLTTGVIRVWTHRDDIYIAAEDVPSWKVSLHGDEAWRMAMTSEHVASGKEPVLPATLDRAPWKFEPTSWVGDVRRVFVVCALRSALLPRPLDEDACHVLVVDRWDEATGVHIWMTEAGADFVDDDMPCRQIGGRALPLSSGRKVWLFAGTEEVEGSPEPAGVGSIVEPLIPATHGVSTPGWLLRGLRLG